MMQPDDELPEGETVDLGDEEQDVIDTPDGGAIVKLHEDEENPVATEFYDNLAGTLVDDIALSRIVVPLVDLIARDKEARKERDEQQAEGLRRTGLANEAPGGAKFEGASKVVHPMLLEAAIDFGSRTIQELFPAGGPAKDYIPGKVTAEKVAKAKRKTALMNWQLTTQCKEFRAELEQTLTQVPMGGAQYLHMSWDTRRNRPRSEFVAIDDMLLPYAATNFYSAQRKTHVEYITQVEYEKRVKAGDYRDVDLVPTSMEPENTASGEANDKIEGRESTSYNEDGLRIVWNCYTELDLEDDTKVDGAAPYLITIDKATNKVLGLYRNWDEQRGPDEALDHFVEFPFIPWRGAYPLGLSNIIGTLSGAATGALRALLDSAHINNSASMLKLKSSMGGQDVEIDATGVSEIDAGLGIDDIRKMAMPIPFNPPSPVLFELLGFLVEAGKGVVATALEDAADTNVNAPVGTTMARIEQGMAVYKAVHGRLHDAMARLLAILHRLNATHLDAEKLEYDVGEELATAADFQGPVDVVPVSDPNIFSEMQRYAQVQSLVQRSDARPDLYDSRKVEERVLETLRIADPEDLLLPATQPQEKNAVNENAAAALGQPITAFPGQDHLAHLQTHMAFMQTPVFGNNPQIIPSLAPTMLNHIKEHMVWWYVSDVFHTTSDALGTDVGEMMRDLGRDEESRRMLDGLLAEGGMIAAQNSQQTFEGLMPFVEQLQQVVAQIQQQAAASAPQDPAIAVMQADVDRKAAADQQNAALKQGEQQLAQQEQQNRLALDQAAIAQKAQTARDSLAVRVRELQERYGLDQAKSQSADALKREDIDARVAMNREDNLTAEELLRIRLEHEARQSDQQFLRDAMQPDYPPDADAP